MHECDTAVPPSPAPAAEGAAAPPVDVLLSTRDGGKFVQGFVASLGRQTDRNFRLLVRDDGSRDDTVAIVRMAAERHGVAARFVPSSGEHLGVTRSFGELLKCSDATYALFADQDDLWHDDKIHSMREAMRQAERKFGGAAPLVVHSDLRVCGERGEPVAASFLRRSHLFPPDHRLVSLMIQNDVTGCATMINRALKSRIRLPFPDEAICHDWYLALLAAAVGNIVFLDRPLVDYRIHGDNVFGAPEYGLSSWLRILRGGRGPLRRRLEATRRQAGAFLDQYGDLLDDDARERLGAWSKLDKLPKLRRLAVCFRYGFRKNTLPRTLGMWWAL